MLCFAWLAWLAWLACLLAWLGLLGLLAWLACLACLPGLFGSFVALAVRGPGVPDRGEMEKEKEDKKWADFKLKSNNPTLNGGEQQKHLHESWQKLKWAQGSEIESRTQSEQYIFSYIGRSFQRTYGNVCCFNPSGAICISEIYGRPDTKKHPHKKWQKLKCAQGPEIELRTRTDRYGHIHIISPGTATLSAHTIKQSFAVDFHQTVGMSERLRAHIRLRYLLMLFVLFFGSSGPTRNRR